ncbi:Uncharacterized conserved protein YqcC, DUF446 family [Pseudomonas guineae]|uniref:Uncharacterized conserved protein YqcC, DUF446 family n=1 Tax=Pseudomonas guineae TaxID=425504 RepID=A0A1I3MJM4_9PSED|nr:YqcC family protein [Pseudomonas guineae]SFI97218.1 Uncharacterized conserved protein YqcC, DUF446 family [Pseudomonas guineae]
MDARTPAVAEQLLLIERELRLQGWWGTQAPDTRALSSELPFCVDTLAFEQWLQWLFLPRMKQMLEAGADLPSVSGIQSMAEQVYDGQAERARALIKLLGEFDQLIVGAT